MAEYVMIQGSTLSAIADAIREQGLIYNNMTPTQIPSYIQEKFTSEDQFKSILDRTVSTIDYNFNTVGAYAFANCSNLKNINLPQCETIGTSAFLGCSPEKVTLGIKSLDSADPAAALTMNNKNLRELNLPECISLYSSTVISATNLVKVSLPKVDVLTGSAFFGCTSLTEVSLPVCGTTTTFGIGANAFRGCTSLSKVYAPMIKSMNGSAFYGTPLEELYAPNLVSMSSTDSLGGITTLKSVTIGYTTIPAWTTKWPNLEYFSDSQATTILAAAFSGCKNLNENGFYAPNLTSISIANAFRGTGFVNIDETVFPKVSGTIGDYTFYACPSLKSVRLSLVSSVNNRVFGGCPNLEYVKLDNVTYMYTNASYPAFQGCTALKTVIFPAYSKQIVTTWLNGLTALTNVDIPQAVQINTNAFLGCTSLSKVSFPAVATIQSNAFSGCTSLNTVDIGTAGISTVATLATNAFLNCKNLSSLYIRWGSMATLANYSTVFSGTGITASTGSIYVPYSLLLQYKGNDKLAATDHPWGYYSNQIFPFDYSYFQIRGVDQTYPATVSNLTWTEWQNNYSFSSIARYYFIYSVYSSWTYTGNLTGQTTTRYAWSARQSATSLYQTSIPGTFSFIGWSGMSGSFGSWQYRVQTGPSSYSYTTFIGVSIVSQGTSYISYIKFAEPTASITTFADYTTGIVGSTLPVT